MRLPAIPPIDAGARARAEARQRSLTKPRGSLGRLEELSVRLAGMTGLDRPSVKRKAVAVFAGDHGVCEEGVSAYPSDVTGQMVLNFLRGGAAISVLARLAGARLAIVNIGVRGPLALADWAARLPPSVRAVDRPVAPGTANLARGPALSRQEAEQAVQVGLEVAGEEADQGLDLFATGEMGIGNTTAAAAVVAALTGEPPGLVTGRGTGVDDAGLERKIAAIERGLAVNRPDPRDAMDVLAKVGGLEIAGLSGAILGAASRRVPVVLDGFITGAAALAAVALDARAAPYLIAGHRSVEAGHRVVLERLGLTPLLDLELRLGEGTGAALAFPLIEAAARLLDEMATFSEAGVSEDA